MCHGGDLPYTFGSTGPYNFTSIGREITDSHMFYWSNFAASSSPNPPVKENNENVKKMFDIWPEYETNNRTYLRFASPTNLIQNSYLKSACDFFDKIGYYY